MKHIRSASIILLLIFALACSVRADMTPVRITLGARELMVSPQAVFDGGKVMVPLGLIDLLGITYSSDTPGKVTVTNALGISADVATNGAGMVDAGKLADAIGLDRKWDADKHTLALAARMQSVEFADNILKVNCTIPVSYKVTSWDTGGKLIVDMSAARIATPSNEIAADSILVKRIRLGEPDASTARVVLDLIKPVSYKIDSAPLAAVIRLAVTEKTGARAVPKPVGPQPPKPFKITDVRVESLNDSGFQVVIATSGRGSVSPSFVSKPPRITVNLPGGVLADPSLSCNGSDPLLSNMNITNDPASGKVRIDLDLKRTMVYETRVDDAAITVCVMPPAKSGGQLSDKTIVIDPGHGNPKYGKIDTGARGGDVAEKDCNLAIANEVVSALQEQGAKVIVTRTGDNGLSLEARPQMAVDAGADFFISIHCNSNGTLNSATGIETYYHMNGPSEKLLAEAIHDSVCVTTGMCDRKAHSDKQLYNTGLAVLRGLEGTGIPGVLIECGYVNNSSDRCKLIDHEYQMKLAKGIVAGLKEYIEGK